MRVAAFRVLAADTVRATGRPGNDNGSGSSFMSDAGSQQSTGLYKAIGYVASIAGAVLFVLLIDGGSVEVLSVDVPVLVLAIVSYVLGWAAAWGFMKSRAAS